MPDTLLDTHLLIRHRNRDLKPLKDREKETGWKNGMKLSLAGQVHPQLTGSHIPISGCRRDLLLPPTGVCIQA